MQCRLFISKKQRCLNFSRECQYYAEQNRFGNDAQNVAQSRRLWLTRLRDVLARNDVSVAFGKESTRHEQQSRNSPIEHLSGPGNSPSPSLDYQFDCIHYNQFLTWHL